MNIITKTITLTIIFNSAHSLERLHEDGLILNKIIQLLSNKTPVRRNHHTWSNKFIKHVSRQGNDEIDDIPVDKGDKMVENELKNSLDEAKSALLERPYVENEGRHDYLVLTGGEYDHFVTVIPNAMYQQVENKCVNWLDDCSIKGIRARLLRGIHSPFR